MGYLGLSEPLEKEDNLLQRLFWPGDHAGETDTLGQQGFWICAVVAIGSLVVLAVQGHWILALLTLAFFGLGGIGVREHSTVAAVLVAVAYVLNLIANVMAGKFPGFLTIAAAVLLIANIRGSWVAAKWAKRGDPESFPERMRETWRDRLVDQMPAWVWPRARIAFFCVAGIYMLLLLLGTVMLSRRVSEPGASQQTQYLLDVKPSR
jgi:hypothetical protein